jgi:hypothetical protein
MLPGWMPWMVFSGPIPRALAQVPQVATSPRRASEAIILSML